MLHAQTAAFGFSYRLPLAIDCSSLNTRRLTHWLSFNFAACRVVNNLYSPVAILANTWWLGSLAGRLFRTCWHLSMASGALTSSLCIYFHNTAPLASLRSPLPTGSSLSTPICISGPLLLIAYSCIHSFIHMPEESWGSRVMSTLLVFALLRKRKFSTPLAPTTRKLIALLGSCARLFIF